jgi:hypothetical protein
MNILGINIIEIEEIPDDVMFVISSDGQVIKIKNIGIENDQRAD